MTDKNEVWVDPHGRALRFLEEVERQRKEKADCKHRKEQAMKQEKENKNVARTQAPVAVPKAEILPPASHVPALPPLEMNGMQPPDLSDLEHQIRHAAKMLDLSVPEGRLDEWFGRPNHRIATKTERAELIAGYISACGSILDAARHTVEAAGAAQRSRYQLHIDRVSALRALLAEHYRMEFAHREAVRQEAIEDAKAKAEIARYEAEAREQGLRGKPALPLPPAPPAPKPEDPRVKKKASLQQELDRLATEEKADLAKISGGKPQGEWTDEVKEEITRTINMYYHAREKVREELRNFL